MSLNFVKKLTVFDIKRLVPSFGFEQALLRNLVQLSNYLRLHRRAEDIASIARGAIQFIIGDHGQHIAEEGQTGESQIREVADELLQPGQRDMSKEWQRSFSNRVRVQQEIAV